MTSILLVFTQYRCVSYHLQIILIRLSCIVWFLDILWQKCSSDQVIELEWEIFFKIYKLCRENLAWLSLRCPSGLSAFQKVEVITTTSVTYTRWPVLVLVTSCFEKYVLWSPIKPCGPVRQDALLSPDNIVNKICFTLAILALELRLFLG